MELQSTINFLVGSVLFSVGAIIISIMVLIVNNLFSKYWKSINWNIYNPVEYRFIDPSTMTEVQVEKRSTTKEKTNK